MILSREMLMFHLSLTPFGRQPVTAGLLAARALAANAPALPGNNLASIDKWALFNDLRLGRDHFQVSDRDLGVLYALLTFLPAKVLAEEADLLVFPSNASLSDRAHGMAESTLRRHLAALVRAGLIWRHDSPNGKRYAARDRSGAVVVAYGFDLRPLLSRASEILQAAEAARALAEETRRQRELLVLRLRDAAKLIAYGRETNPTDWDAVDARLTPLRRALRRGLDVTTLADLVAVATALLDDIIGMLSSESEEMHGTDAHFGRHHTNSNKDSSDFEPCPEKGRAAGLESPDPETIEGGSSDPASADNPVSDRPLPSLPLYLIVKACPDLEPYAKGRLETWHQLVGAAGFVRGMMGISASAWEEAQHVMGPETAAIVVAAMLQRIASISNPGGYLRALSAKAAIGEFSVGPMIMALLNGAKS